MRLFGKLAPPVEARYGMTEYIQLVSDALASPMQMTYTAGSNRENVRADYTGNGRGQATNGPIWALNAFRVALFSQVRWCYQQLRNGVAGDLFSQPVLDVVNLDALLNPLMMMDVNLGGNFYGRYVADDAKVRRLRPDWVAAMGNGPLDHYDTDIVGYAYYRGGIGVCPPEDVELLPAAEVVHWAPQPDPECPWRGMSWLTPVARELQADSKATEHKLKFFENGATSNLALKYDPSVSFEQFQKFKDAFNDDYTGTRNAYKVLHLGGAVDPTVIGADFRQMDFKVTQGAGESRLAAAAQVHPVCVGFSEGMQGSSLNAGNFGQARRSTVDTLGSWLWSSAAAALGEVLPLAGGARFWYDATAHPFLREDALDVANIKHQDSVTFRQFIDAGFVPDSVKAAMTGGDWTLLQHSGLFSVQLQPPTMSVPAQSTNVPGRSLSIVRDEHGFVAGVEVAG